MKKFVIANWKLYLSQRESIQLAQALLAQNIMIPAEVEVVLCPSLTAVGDIARLVQGSDQTIKVGGQDCFWEERGHFTGEVSAQDLKAVGCEFVLVGHSERRQHLHETDEMVNRKLQSALAADLVPVLCIGETLDEKNQGNSEARVITQLSAAVKGVELGQGKQRLLVAYEPIWAISPSPLEEAPGDAEKMCNLIKHELIDRLGEQIYLKCCAVIYGGSVASDNVSDYLSQPSISGVLPGHAATRLDEFVKILQTAGAVI